MPPQTVWQSTDGLSDFTSGDASYIVDTTGTFLVDPSLTYIVDTGVLNSRIPATVWITDDSI